MKKRILTVLLTFAIFFNMANIFSFEVQGVNADAVYLDITYTEGVQPELTLRQDGTYRLTVNMASWMEWIEGIYEVKSDMLILHVNEPEYGMAWGFKFIEFKILPNGNLQYTGTWLGLAPNTKDIFAFKSGTPIKAPETPPPVNNTYDEILLAEILLKNSYYKFYKENSGFHGILAKKISEDAAFENLVKGYYYAIEDILALKAPQDYTDFYEIVLYDLITNDNCWKSTGLGIYSDFLKEQTSVAGDYMINQLLKSMGKEETYDNIEKLLNTKTPDALKEIQKFFKDNKIADTTGLLIFEAKTIRDVMEAYKRVIELQNITDEKITFLNALSEYSGDKKVKDAADNLIKEIKSVESNPSFAFYQAAAEQTAEDAFKKLANTALNELANKNKYVKMYKTAYDFGHWYNDTFFNTEDISADIISLIVITAMDDNLRIALDKAETDFTKSKTPENAKKLIELANSFKAVQIKGVDVSEKFVNDLKSVSELHQKISITVGIITLNPGLIYGGVFGDKTDYNHVLASMVSYRASLELADFYDPEEFLSSESNNQTAAIPSPQKVLVNGKEVAFDAYNINGSNYFKLRDLAYILSGTEKQFEVGWDEKSNAISLASGKKYTEVGGEMAKKSAGNKTATPTTSKIYLDGKEISLTAYNINGNNYFKLRDIGEKFDFGVTWDAKNNAVLIDTGVGYIPE